MTFQPCRPVTIKLLPYESAPFGGRFKEYDGLFFGEDGQWGEKEDVVPLSSISFR